MGRQDSLTSLYETKRYVEPFAYRGIVKAPQGCAVHNKHFFNNIFQLPHFDFTFCGNLACPENLFTRHSAFEAVYI